MDRNSASFWVRRLRVGFALLAVVLAFNAPGTMSAQPDKDRSLTADKPNPAADKAAAEKEALDLAKQPPATNAPPEVASLSREQLEAKVKALSDSLTSANSEAEFFRQQWQELRLRDEALGVEALTGDAAKVNDKLVSAVAELYQSEMKRREALQILDKLLSTTGHMMQTAPNYDPKVRAEFEIATRAAKEYLAGHSGAMIPIAATLADGKISDVNPQLNAVVLNVGKQQGAKEGMNFLVYQGDKQVATAKVELAREVVSAALVQNLQAGITLKVGDKVVVDAGQ